MEIIIQIVQASIEMFREASLYILLGFFVAGLLKAWISPETVGRYFARGRFRSVLHASLLGIPIPL